MSNSLLTINMITREAVRLWKNSNAFIQNLDMQYDDSFARTGAKIGTSLRVRLPNDYVVRTGPALQAQDTAEQSTTLVLATQQGVDVSFNSVDMTMSLDDYSERILAPMVNNLAGSVANTIMQGVEGGVCNYVSNTDASGNVISPTSETYLNAGAVLSNNSGLLTDRKVVNSPRTEARVVNSLSGLFNPVADISKQYKSAKMYDALNFLWFSDQTVINHTTGTFTAGTVSGANQTGTTLTTNAITGTLTAGDIITIASVYAVNRITKVSTGELRQFVVTAAVASGATSIPIYPAIIPAASGGGQVQYQTVTVSPANGAAISLVNKASEVYRKNIAWAPSAVTMATADLYMPQGVAEAAREQFDGISMRMIRQYLIQTDQEPCRLDVLFGYLYTRPEWLCVVADAI